MNASVKTVEIKKVVAIRIHLDCLWGNDGTCLALHFNGKIMGRHVELIEAYQDIDSARSGGQDIYQQIGSHLNIRNDQQLGADMQYDADRSVMEFTGYYELSVVRTPITKRPRQ